MGGGRWGLGAIQIICDTPGVISPTLFASIFSTNVFFSSYVLLCSYEKRAQKTLVKLTQGVNFINILCAPLLYKSFFPQLFSNYSLAM